MSMRWYISDCVDTAIAITGLVYTCSKYGNTYEKTPTTKTTCQYWGTLHGQSKLCCNSS